MHSGVKEDDDKGPHGTRARSEYRRGSNSDFFIFLSNICCLSAGNESLPFLYSHIHIHTSINYGNTNIQRVLCCTYCISLFSHK